MSANNQEWGSHLPALLAALLATDGAVLEVGAGNWSTPFLRAFTTAAKRYFTSLEADESWAAVTGSILCEYDTVLPKLAVQCAWSVVFLDHSPGPRRANDALLFLNSAEFIVVHDYADDIWEAFEPILGEWRYAEVCDRFLPKTLVLSQRGPLNLCLDSERDINFTLRESL